jgi:16S rRNA (guanine(966)-N(2))-methyltransferase RsmD
MRIVGGKYRGKIFNPPANLKARPTTDFGKEALFNILNNMYDFENVDVLDLFSGTGSISYEFISRGAKSVTAIESNVTHAKFIERQFLAMDASHAKVFKTDVFRYLNSCKRKFDIIFADPPYDLVNYEEIYNSIMRNKLLTEASVLIIEHSSKHSFSDFPHFSSMRNYGSVHFSFFELV